MTGPLTFLTSARNSLVTVYDVSEGEDAFGHLNVLPYALPSIPIVGERRVGQLVFRHPNNACNSSATLLQLSDRGSIHQLNLELSADGQARQPTGRTHDWSQEVLDLEKTMETATSDVGVFGGRTYTEVDLEPVYRRESSFYLYVYLILTLDVGIFSVDEPAEVEDPAAFYDTLDSMPMFWKNLEDPVEQVLTT